MRDTRDRGLKLGDTTQLAVRARTWVRSMKRMAANLLGKNAEFVAPSFLIIGAQKCGTTALHAYLSRHPQTVPSSTKEINYFCSDDVLALGPAWYKTQFPVSQPAHPKPLTYEASPNYVFTPQVPERLHAYCREMKIILLLRNPVARAFSAWNHYVHRNPSKHPDLSVEQAVETRSFEQVVKDEIDGVLPADQPQGSHYLARGRYAEQIRRFLKFFPREQILIIESYRLLHETTNVLVEVGDFLQLDPFPWQAEDIAPHGCGTYSTKMSLSASSTLQDYYSSYNQELYSLLGQDFGWEEEPT